MIVDVDGEFEQVKRNLELLEQQRLADWEAWCEEQRALSIEPLLDVSGELNNEETT